MKINTQQEADNLNLGDAIMRSIIWHKKDEPELTIRVELSNEKIADLTFSWFTNLKIDMDCRVYSEALTYEVITTKKENGWSVVFDFRGTPEGAISLDCNELIYEESC